MAFATNGDLLKYIPTIFDHGTEDFSDEIAQAEADVKRYIEINWYNKNFGTGYDQIGRRVGADFDATLLTETQWNRATVYRALYAYILPQLATWRPDGDSFTEQLKHYRERYHEEIDAEMAKGVEYDLNDDGTLQRNEKYRHRKDRLYR